MKLLACYSKSHEVFLPRFLETRPKEIDLILRYLPQVCPTGEYGSEGFNEAVRRKISTILDYLILDDLLFCDVDIQFFHQVGPGVPSLHSAAGLPSGQSEDYSVVSIIKKELQTHDLTFQREVNNYVNTGFFGIKKSLETIKFFQQVYSETPKYREDQHCINTLLKNSRVSFSILPDTFTRGSIPLENADVCKRMLMHHGNYVKGVDNKLRLLERVRYVRHMFDVQEKGLLPKIPV